MATSAVEPTTVEQLTQRADLVVLGRVARFRTALEGSQIFTYVTFEVKKSLKGEAPELVTVRVLGGEAEGLRMRVVGAPCLHEQEEAVLFLMQAKNSLEVVDMSMGKFTLVRQGKTTLVQRDLDGFEFLHQGDVKDPETLEELAKIVLNVKD